MKYIKLFEYFSDINQYNFDPNLHILLQNQRAHIETRHGSRGDITYLKLWINNNWVGNFYQKNKSGITRFREENTRKMGTLISSLKSGNSVILEIKFDDQQNSQKLDVKFGESIPSCDIPKSKYIPKGKGLESIKLIQRGLSEVDGGKYKKTLGNFGPDKDGIDGQYGCSTLQTISQFQKDNNIRPSGPYGIFGPITSDVLSQKLGRHVPPHGVVKRDVPQDFITLVPKNSPKIEKSS